MTSPNVKSCFNTKVGITPVIHMPFMGWVQCRTSHLRIRSTLGTIPCSVGCHWLSVSLIGSSTLCIDFSVGDFCCCCCCWTVHGAELLYVLNHRKVKSVQRDAALKTFRKRKTTPKR